MCLCLVLVFGVQAGRGIYRAVTLKKKKNKTANRNNKKTGLSLFLMAAQ